MPHPTSHDESHSVSALRKGAACLQCRKRKMRCSGEHPICNNCVKGKKECQYAAGRAKTKTQMLREKIQDLESKIKQLEQGVAAKITFPDSPATTPDHENSDLFDETDFSSAPGSGSVVVASQFRSGGSNSSPSSSGSPPFGTQHEYEFTFSEEFLAATSSTGGPYTVPSKSFVNGPASAFTNWWEMDDPPLHIQLHLIEVFMARAGEFQLSLSKTTFLESIRLPSPQSPHPALMNAIYLLGCHFTRLDEYTRHEALYLSRAREALLSSLAHSDRLFDFLIASNLVAYYLYRTGRFLEGHHQTAGAARFAVSCGLHQIVSPILNDGSSESPRGVRASAPWSVSDMSVRRPGSMLTPPKNGVELGLRIIVFWTTYLLDKLGSAVTSLPGSLPDEADPLTEIQTIWPRSIEEYELGDVSNDEYATIRSLYEPQPLLKRRPETLLGLQAQITALHERASRLSASFSGVLSPAATKQFWITFEKVDTAIHRFHMALPPLRNMGSMAEIHGTESSPINPTIFVIHTLSHLAIIQLHNALAPEMPSSYDRCLHAAREILALALTLTLDDFQNMSMEMIHSYAWTTTAQVLIRHMRNLRMQGRFEEMTSLDLEINSVVHAMSQMRGTYPVVGFQLGKIDEWRRA